MIRLAQWSLVLLILFSAQACLVIDNQFSAIPPGEWRGVLRLQEREITAEEVTPDDRVGMEFEEVTEGELPFNFEVVYESETDFHLIVKNGAERIRVDDITFGVDRRTARDTIRIEMPVFDSYISAFYEEDIIEGEWVDNSRQTDYRIHFIARHGQSHRFTRLEKEPAMDVTGIWEATFGLVEGQEPYKAIGEFEQDGNHLTGTFRTETGDYRYLEGTVQGDKLYLSTFDGSHAYLFEAKILPDSTLIGSFLSGIHYRTTWDARRNPNAELADSDSLTYLKEGYDTFDFTFEHPDGEMVSLTDEAFEGKVKIVQIMGTYCPNCWDETRFLVDYLNDNPTDDLAIIGLAFERYTDKDEAMQAIQRYRKKLNVPYPILLAGEEDKKAAAKALPMLNHILAYPTLVFVDKNNVVRRIETGFFGPATSAYQPFTEEFDAFVQELLQEQAEI